MTPDPPHVERRSSWRDGHLDCICGLANGRGGVLDIGREVRREAIGATDLLRLAAEITTPTDPITTPKTGPITGPKTSRSTSASCAMPEPSVAPVHPDRDTGRSWQHLPTATKPPRRLPQRLAQSLDQRLAEILDQYLSQTDPDPLGSGAGHWEVM